MLNQQQQDAIISAAPETHTVQSSGVSRRRFVQAGAAVAAAGSIMGKKAFASSRPLKIGYVSPETGSLAPFGEADQFVVSAIRQKLQGGILSGGGMRQVEILVRDSQSSPNRAAEVAAQMIKSDRVDLLLAAGTPETVNPVSDQAEINGVPCVTTDAPWQATYFDRGGKPNKGFDWTYHFFFGVETISQVMCDIFSLVPTNKKIGLLLGNDHEGNMFSDKVKGFPPIFQSRGFNVFDPGRFQITSTDFSAQIASFKQAGCEICYGNMPLPVFSTFWSQAKQQGYKPKVCTIGKAILMPAAVASLGQLGKNLSCEIWWSRAFPFKSGLTGQSASQLCDAYEAFSRKQWTQALGFRHALFEVAVDVLKRAKSDTPQGIIEAVRNTHYNSIVGPIQWQGAPPNKWTQIPVKNVCTTPIVSGQWVQGKKWPYEIVCTDNRRYPSIKVERKMQAL
jgi:branched-chain amino acid transport system substrate-binding protein